MSSLGISGDAMSKSIAAFLFATALIFASRLTVAPAAAATDPLLAQAEALAQQGKYPRALAAAEKALRAAETAYGKEDSRLATPLEVLAHIYALEGKKAEAAAHYRRALAILRASSRNKAEIASIESKLASLNAEAVHDHARRQDKTAVQAGSEAHRAAPETRSLRIQQAPPQASSSGGTEPLSPSQLLPSFPWPPPASSASYVFPKEVFSRYQTVGEVSSAILSALEHSGYVERSFFQTKPGGVALVTRLERIDSNGTPVDEAQRWPAGFKAKPSDLVAFLKGLFYVTPGHFRVIVFILQDLPFTQSSKGVSADDAKTWLREGANMLPPDMAKRPFGNGACTALIYEFESDGSAVKMVEGGLTGKEHLEKAGLLATLEQAH